MSSTTPGPAGTDAEPAGASKPGAASAQAKKLAALVAGLVAAVGLMLLVFAAPAVHSGAHDLPLGVAGPAPAVTALTSALDEHNAGAFDVTVYDSPEAATNAVKDRKAIGAITLAPDQTTIVTASAAGSPYAAVLKGLGSGLAAQGQKVTYLDVAPLTSDDPSGAGLTATALPIIFGGMASAVALSTLLRGERTPVRRVAGSLTFALIAGFVVTAILQYGFGSLAGSYVLTSLVAALGIAAVSLVVLGLESLLGYAGIGLGAVIMLFISNPISGFATGPQWLPHPWGEIGQFLPIGATGTAVRSLAFFDGHGATRALIVLTVWVLAGITLNAASIITSRRSAPAAQAS